MGPSHKYPESHRDLSREQLYELVWSEPVDAAAKRFDISGVALAKACRRQSIPLPARGYWARKKAGHSVSQDPLPPAPEASDFVHQVRERRRCAIYLVGHGPLRGPRLIELQLVRIGRYMGALATKLGVDFEVVGTFVDVNWHRASCWDVSEFPSFVELLGAIKDERVQSVVIDIEQGDPRNLTPYDIVVPLLRKSGAKAYNAHYDDEEALKSAIERRYGPGSARGLWYGPGDASDIVAFFPALVCSIGMQVMEDDERHSDTARRFRNLGEESPYASSQYPFLGTRLERRLIEEKLEREKREREQRRASGERLFLVDPGLPPVLLDEGLYFSEKARTDEQLRWAEARLQNDLGVKRVIDGSVATYETHVDGYRILADPRRAGSISFRVFRSPSGRKNRRRKTTFPASGSFAIQDRWLHALKDKFDAAVRRAIAALEGGSTP